MAATIISNVFGVVENEGILIKFDVLLNTAYFVRKKGNSGASYLDYFYHDLIIKGSTIWQLSSFSLTTQANLNYFIH
jgi:hypothetical protein